jgi:phosphoribosyl-dephospho-CoA transferase
MRRHDLAWVRPGAPLRFQCGLADDGLSARVGAWIGSAGPLVVARQVAGSGEVLLGLTLPASEGRRRIGCLVHREDVLRVCAPLRIGDCLAGQANELAAPLVGLESRLAACGVEAGVYGSLAWEALSGETYRHADSDVDLICDVASMAQALACIQALEDTAARLPCGLDGEVRFPAGCALAWRELAAGWHKPDARVLVKGGIDVGLLPLAAVLAQFEEDHLHA